MQKFSLPIFVTCLFLLAACGPEGYRGRSDLTNGDQARVQTAIEPIRSGTREYEDFQTLPTEDEIFRQTEPSPDKAPAEPKLDIQDARLQIDVDHSTMKFSARIGVGNDMNQFELEGSFAESRQEKKPYWSVDNLKPIDPQIRKQRRIQGTALCLRAAYCDEVAVEIFFKHDGKLYRRQITQKLDPLYLPAESKEEIKPKAPQSSQQTPTDQQTPADTFEPAESKDEKSDEGEEQVVVPPKATQPANAPSTPAKQPASPATVPSAPPKPAPAKTAPAQTPKTHKPPKAPENKPDTKPTEPKKPETKPAPQKTESKPMPAKPAPTKPAPQSAPAPKKAETKPAPAPVKAPTKEPAKEPAKQSTETKTPPPQKQTPEPSKPTQPEKKAQIAPAAPAKKNAVVVKDQGGVKTVDGEFVMPKPKIDEDSIDELVERFGKPGSVGKEPDRIQAIGKHDGGRLKNPAYLPFEGPGYFRTRPKVEKNGRDTVDAYGTDTVIEFILSAAKALMGKIPGLPRMIVGEIAAYAGGNSGHASHQNGLDADIGFFAKNTESKSFWIPLTKKNTPAGAPEFDFERNWNLLKLAFKYKHTDGNADHFGNIMAIFVDRKIKRSICEYAKQAGEKPKDAHSTANEILTRVQHWDGHQNHFHMRFYCPNTVGCRNTYVLPTKDVGC